MYEIEDDESENRGKDQDVQRDFSVTVISDPIENVRQHHRQWANLPLQRNVLAILKVKMRPTKRRFG